MNRRTLLAAVPAVLAVAFLGSSVAEAHKAEFFPGLRRAFRKMAKQQRKKAK